MSRCSQRRPGGTKNRPPRPLPRSIGSVPKSSTRVGTRCQAPAPGQARAGARCQSLRCPSGFFFQGEKKSVFCLGGEGFLFGAGLGLKGKPSRKKKKIRNWGREYEGWNATYKPSHWFPLRAKMRQVETSEHLWSFLIDIICRVISHLSLR